MTGEFWKTTWLSMELSNYIMYIYILAWPMAKLQTFWDYIFSRENKPFKLLFQGPGRLSEYICI